MDASGTSLTVGTVVTSLGEGGQHHNHILHLLPGVMAEAAVQKISPNCWVFQTKEDMDLEMLTPFKIGQYALH